MIQGAFLALFLSPAVDTTSPPYIVKCIHTASYFDSSQEMALTSHQLPVKLLFESQAHF